MTENLTSQQVWQTLENEIFAVLGMVNARNQARSIGIAYIVNDQNLYIATGTDTWKARHIRQNPHVSLTVPIAKRIPLMPWMKIPSATITFSGEASVLDQNQVKGDVLHALFRGAESDEEVIKDMCIIKVEPHGDFITYGIGIPMMDMRTPEKARGRAPVALKQ